MSELALYGTIALELFLGFIALFIIMKALGKAHLSQLTPFDFISALIMGELLGNAIYDQEVHIGQVAFAAAFWGLLIYSNAWVTQKVKGLRKVLEGEPSIVIRNGKLQPDIMRTNHLDLNELQSLVRQQGYFALQEVEYAILETNGSVSVMPKSANDIPRRSEWKLPAVPQKLPVTLIMDGEIMYENLTQFQLTEHWLMQQLSDQGIADSKDVFYAEWLEGGSLYVSVK